MSNYAERITLPLSLVPEDTGIEFKTRTGTLVATGYVRVVIGGRGPYVEFSDDQINRAKIDIPPAQMWRTMNQRNAKFGHYYEEYRTVDAGYVKLYRQLKTVDYADYRVGYWYVSPFELTTDKYPVLVKPLDKKSRLKVNEPLNEGDVFEGY